MPLPCFKRPNLTFILKIDLPALLAFIFFAGLIFLYLIPGFEKIMMDRKRSMIHEITSSAYSIMDYYNNLSKEGSIDLKDAQNQAKAAVSTIRYGESLKDYFWITDMHPRMIVHPYRPDLNGKDLTEFRDSKGKTIFVDFVKAVSASGESYVEYMWQWNDDSTRVVPKLSYVRLYEPWGWIIGTGIYIEDVKTEIHRIESRALVISAIIALLIIILLIVISQQGHRIEQKRSIAEEELRKSRELYRTLAEAASEGVMIWSDQGLQANKTLLTLLGYNDDDFQYLNLSDIFSSQVLPGLSDPASLYDELSTRRYLECLLQTKDNEHIKSYADFSRILLGEKKAVLMVLRPVKTGKLQTDFAIPALFLDNLCTGFFRTTYGRKTKFIYASEPTVKMLGFSRFQDIIPYSIDSFLFNPVEMKAFRLKLVSKENIFRKEVLIKRKDGDLFWALVSIMVVESSSNDIWCEGTIEPLALAPSKQSNPLVDLKSYSASYIMESPVYSIMQTPLLCSEKRTLKDALVFMKENNNEFAIITDKNGEAIGIAESGKAAFKLTEGPQTFDMPVGEISIPPTFISYDAKINEAFEKISNSKSNCAIVSAGLNRIAGIITKNDLMQPFFTAPEILIEEIALAESATALHHIYIKCRKVGVSMIIGKADPYAVSLYLSSIADIIFKRVVALCIEHHGEPPCRFTFILTGSAGRMEQTLSTDQDNAIIFENRNGVEHDDAMKYFLSLGKSVNEMLAEIGYSLCKGGNMAGNEKWCQPIDKWKRYFSDWIKAPGPDELLEISIFFDFRFCFGDLPLYKELSDFIGKDLQKNDIFFHHMAASISPFNPSGKALNENKTDIKKLLLPLTAIIRLYSLRYGINGYSTIERIIEIYSAGKIDHKLLRDSIRAWKDLTSVRFSHQASQIGKGYEADNMVDFQLIENESSAYAEQAIKTIRELMLMTGNDFYTTSI